MYKIQIIDALTQEILREKTYDDAEAVLGLIDYVKKGRECFLFDDRNRLMKAEYITHYVAKEEGFVVYKVFLQLDTVEVLDIDLVTT